MEVQHITEGVRKGRVVVRVNNEAREYPTAVEALISECKLAAKFVSVDAKNKHPGGGLLPKQMQIETQIPLSSVSRVKNGKEKMPNHWLIKLHIWSGLPLKDLEALAGIESEIQPHWRLNAGRPQ